MKFDYNFVTVIFFRNLSLPLVYQIRQRKTLFYHVVLTLVITAITRFANASNRLDATLKYHLQISSEDKTYRIWPQSFSAKLNQSFLYFLLLFCQKPLWIIIEGQSPKRTISPQFWFGPRHRSLKSFLRPSGCNSFYS